MVGLCIRGRGAFIALGLGAASCRLALDFDYEFSNPADAGSVQVAAGDGGVGGTWPDVGGAGGTAGSGVSQGNGGDGVSPVSTAGSGPDAPGAGGDAAIGGAAGTSSVSGAGGTPSTSGAGGDAANAGAGSGGSGGSGGTGEPAPPCTGCVELIVPFSEPGVATFQVDLGADAAALDFSGGALVWTLQVPNPDPRLSLKVAIQNGPELSFAGLFTFPEVPIDAPAYGPGVWTPLRLDAAPYPGPREVIGAEAYLPETFDKAQVRILSLELGVRGDELAEPVELHLLIDQVSVENVVGGSVFDFSIDTHNFLLEQASDDARVIHHPANPD